MDLHFSHNYDMDECTEDFKEVHLLTDYEFSIYISMLGHRGLNH